MKNIKWLLIAVLLLKIATYTLRVIFNPNTKEVEQFINKEVYRKHNDHSMDFWDIRGAFEYHAYISSDTMRHYLWKQNDDKWSGYDRTRFQDNARYFRTLDIDFPKTADLYLKSYPVSLQNAVAEESAKHEILLMLDKLEKGPRIYNRHNLIGLLSYAEFVSDSMRVSLVPFVFPSQILYNPFCQCGSQVLLTKNNPFYYTGSLTNCKCTFQNPISKEIQVYDLQRIE